MPSIRLIGIPMDLGQSLRGVDMGAGALRYSNLMGRLKKLGCQVEDVGNIDVPVRDEVTHNHPPFFLPAVRMVCEEAYRWARDAVADNLVPVFLGGDHSISIGTVGGVTHDTERTGLLWIDAHGDFNTPQSSPSGNIHGMSLATLLGLGEESLVNLGRKGAKILREDVVMIGIRDLDPDEKTLLKQHKINVYTMREVDERGMAAVAKEALHKLSHTSRLHVSLDLDCLDPTEAPGVGTPVPGGLTYREAQLLMEMLSDTNRVTSVDVVEVNPILDEHNETAETAAELMESLFGKSIL